MLEFLKRLFGHNSAATSAPMPPNHAPATSTLIPAAKKLTYAEKELLAVQRTTQEDVYQLTGFPYLWNRPIEKFISPNGHPFVYMDIVGENLAVAKSEIARMNTRIEQDKKLSPALKKLSCIPIDEVVFQRNSEAGYSRLMLSPVTYNGKPSKYPVSLFFMSDPWNDNCSGTIFYGQDGTIQKAEIFIGYGSYSLHYETLDGDFTLSRVENIYRETIYKGKHLIERDHILAKTEADYTWLQSNLPENCPGSLTSYRRMRTQNTSSFRALKELAAEKGRAL